MKVISFDFSYKNHPIGIFQLENGLQNMILSVEIDASLECLA